MARARRAPPPAPLEAIAARFRSRVARARRQLGWGAVLLGVVAAAHLARYGTGWLRSSGALTLLLAVGLLALTVIHARRTLASRRRLISATLLRADPVLGAKALRALTLVEREPGAAVDGAAGGESSDLAQLHFQRVLAQAPPDRLERWFATSTDRTRLALLCVVVASGVGVVLDPARIFEGLDVLVARGGHAPLSMTWLGNLSVEAQPPAYLRAADHRLFPEGRAHEPVGSLLTFRGVPEREGRKLVLVGEGREVPFVSDGAGGVVARWTLSKPVTLRVAARFGQVLIDEPEALTLEPIADTAPQVELEGAPRRVQLKDLQSLELRYAVADDYGLREIALVMRAGGREERRTLERLDGEAKQHRGAQAVSPRDAMLRRSFLPIELTVEARDNDGVSGAKWGKSQAITVVPPGIGEGEATRFAALKRARAALISAYATSLRETEAASKKDAPPRAPEARSKEQAELVKNVAGPLRAFAEGTFAGASVPKPLKAFLLGQARALERPALTRETFLRRMEDVLLAVDAALRATGNRDAESVSKRLGDVAEEVAEGCKLGVDPEKRKDATRRLSAAMPVLQGGAAALLTLSELGADLGSVAQGETRRIERGLAAGSYWEAELAARHLAARLRRPKPSFSSAGGGGVEGGGQAGRGGAAQPGEASRAHQQFQELMRELQQLSEEHAGEISSVESALQSASQADQDAELQREAKERADALMRAFEQLPGYAPSQSPGGQAAALSREHGRAMAESMSRLSLKEAKQSADSAKQQLGAAKRASNGDVSPETLREAEQELDKQLGWVEELLKKARERESERAKEALERSSKREQEMAERAQNLSGRGSHGEAALPSEVAEALDRAEGLMRDAAEELAQGRGERGLELQRQAQRLLDQQEDDDDKSQDLPPSDGEKPKNEGPDKEHADMSQRADVPGHVKNQRAEAFRKRVLEGLARDQGGRLGPAVKRYTEGLLK
jgi:Domain of unknown function (DUF4175)